MRAIIGVANQWKKINGLSRSLKMFFAVTIFFGLFYSIRTLFFNFFIISQGFDKEFLGVANSMIPAATLVLGLPLGVFTDRIGRKNAAVVGLFVMALGYAAMLLTTSSTLILACLFFSGTGETLFIVSRAPLLTRLTNQQNRSFVFSFNFALFTLAGIVGNSIGGQLPIWFDSLFKITPNTTASYQGVLFAGLSLAALALIPAVLIAPGSKNQSPARSKISKNKSNSLLNLQNIMRNKVVWKLASAVLLVGLGVGLINPFFNLFFVETFEISNQLLGNLFSAASLLTGVSCLAGPWLSTKLGGRMNTNIITQIASLVFLLMLGFSPWLGLSMLGLIGYSALLQMGIPLFTAYAMEQVEDNEQGVLNSLLMLSWQAGWAFMPLISGVIQERSGFTPIFLIAAVLLAAGNTLKWIFFARTEDKPQGKVVPQSR
jgi:MFS family permease